MKFNLSIQILGLITAVGMMVVTSGCGGGGGGDNNLAPTSLNNVTLTFKDPDLPVYTTYTFGTANYSSPSPDSGTYTYARTSTINQATLQLNSSSSTILHYTLTFTSRSGGNYLDTDTSKTSTFTAP